MRLQARQSAGFTFIELMLTLALLAVMATIAMPMVQIAHQRKQEQALTESLREIRQAIDAYRRAADQGRISVRAGDSGYPPTLQVLVEGAPDERSASRQRIFFLRRLPCDPLARDLTISPEDTWGQRSYESPPDDPREGKDVFDVFSRAVGKGLNAIPYRQW